MGTYKFIKYHNGSKYQYTEEAKKELAELIKECDFLVFDYIMHEGVDIKGIGDSLRGVTVEFNDGLMTYGYNVMGGYKKE